ncbi:MAG TPA: hypothetical protein VFF86_02305 [Candidatus Methylomirabilis sp.]|nr:hypothetical protein [Candidatus Methylomirabilis sp.]
MPIPRPSVEGPAFAERVRKAEELTQQLAAGQWDFKLAPQLFGRPAACDVFAKEIVNIHDGHVQRRLGRLVMKGAGAVFQLNSPSSALGRTLGNIESSVFDKINQQLGSKGLADLPDFAEVDRLQHVEFYDPTNFYQVRDLIFWSVLHECGLSPSGLEDFATHLAAGEVVRSLLFRPASPTEDLRHAIFMQGFTGVEFPTPVVQWIPKPIYGGVSPQTLHIDTLLTLDQTNLSHPYLDLVAEGSLAFEGRRYYMRRFAGVSPKIGLRGPDVPPEGAKA